MADEQRRPGPPGAMFLFGFLAVMMALGVVWIIRIGFVHPAYWTSVIRITSLVILALVWLQAAGAFFLLLLGWIVERREHSRTGGA